MVKIQVNSQGKAYYTSAGKVLLAPEGERSGKYSLLERISDDSNNEIGTVSGFFTDGNDIEYAVVCLDAQYRLAGGNYMPSAVAVTDLPIYSNWYNNLQKNETATFNTQKILDYCTANNIESDACNHCRSKSFIINGVTYYGQLPNMTELLFIFGNMIELYNLDADKQSYAPLHFNEKFKNTWSSSQSSSGAAWGLFFTNTSYNNILSVTKSMSMFVIPVLEIPNN